MILNREKGIATQYINSTNHNKPSAAAVVIPTVAKQTRRIIPVMLEPSMPRAPSAAFRRRAAH
jgi:hypothetical protein